MRTRRSQNEPVLISAKKTKISVKHGFQWGITNTFEKLLANQSIVRVWSTADNSACPRFSGTRSDLKATIPQARRHRQDAPSHLANIFPSYFKKSDAAESCVCRLNKTGSFTPPLPSDGW